MSVPFQSSFVDEPPQVRARPRLRGPATIRATQGMMNRLAAVGDIFVMFTSALVFQRLGPVGDEGLSLMQAAVVGVVAATAQLAVLAPSDSYRPDRRRRMAPAAFDIVVGVTIAAIACRLLVWAFAPQVLHANTWLAMWTGFVVLALLATRGTALVIGRRFGEARWLCKRTAVVGEPGAGGQLVEALALDPRFHALGLFSDRDDGGQDLSTLRRLAEAEGIDIIVLAAPNYGPKRWLELAAQMQWISADIYTLVDDPEALKGSRLLTEVAGRPALILHRHPLKGAEALVKLGLDCAVAAAALVFLGPLMLVVALALKIAGGGPVLFRQRRLGFNGRPFIIYKFRTMHVDPSDDGSRGAVAGDPRCTGLGAILRKTSLDELPQLFNVLRGEMSIVGPRPHVPNMQVGPGAYAELVRAYAARHQIKPGVTGWAQINGMRGGINTVERARQGVELDLHYIRNWSLWLDLRIILATAFRHLSGPSVF